MRKILAILLLLLGFVFLIWKFLSLQLDLFTSLLLNILGFIPVAIGFSLLKPAKKHNEVTKESHEERKTVLEINEIGKISSTEDHSKYMPQ